MAALNLPLLKSLKSLQGTSDLQREFSAAS
jgi:hypothetical protein